MEYNWGVSTEGRQLTVEPPVVFTWSSVIFHLLEANSQPAKMGWPWIPLSLLNSFFTDILWLNRWIPDVKRIVHIHSEWSPGSLKERHYSFLALNPKIAFLGVERELGTLTKSVRKTSWVTEKALTRGYRLNVLSGSKCFFENLPPWLPSQHFKSLT